jgi:hypothetical protein
LPVKHWWTGRADPALIEQELCRLEEIVDDEPDRARFHPDGRPICLVRPGCGNGGLSWADVRTVIAALLDDRFLGVEKER